MKVWVVAGEYQGTRNGEASWVAGVGKTKAADLLIAREDAESEDKDEHIMIDGHPLAREGEGRDQWDEYDWTVDYTITEHEVRSA